MVTSDYYIIDNYYPTFWPSLNPPDSHALAATFCTKWAFFSYLISVSYDKKSHSCNQTSASAG